MLWCLALLLHIKMRLLRLIQQIEFDQDGNEWKLDTATNLLTKYDLDGKATTTTQVVSFDSTAGTYSFITPNVAGTKFEAKMKHFWFNG